MLALRTPVLCQNYCT